MSTRMQRYNHDEPAERRRSRTETNSRLYRNLETNTNKRTITNLADEKVVITKRPSTRNRETYHSKVEFNDLLQSKPSTKKQNLAELFRETKEEKSNINQILEEARNNREKRGFDSNDRIQKLKNHKITKEDLERYLENKNIKNETSNESDIEDLLNTLTELNLQKRILEKTSELELLNDLLPDSLEETKIEGVISKETFDQDIKMPAKHNYDYTATNRVTLDPSFYTKSMDLSEKDLLSDYLSDEQSTFKNFLKIFTIIILLTGIVASIYFYYKTFF